MPVQPAPEIGQCKVWWARPTGDSRLLARLSRTERDRWAAFREKGDGHRYLAAHALLRTLVSGWTGEIAASLELSPHCVRCGGSDHGPPRLPPGAPVDDIRVSLSHSGRRVAVAASRAAAVGVDVELVSDRFSDDLAALFLAPEERQAWDPIEDADRRRHSLTAYWTRKEAVLKATGDGLAVDPGQLIVTPPGGAPRLVAWNAPVPAPTAVHITDFDLGPVHVGALAVVTPEPIEVQVLDGSGLLLP